MPHCPGTGAAPGAESAAARQPRAPAGQAWCLRLRRWCLTNGRLRVGVIHETVNEALHLFIKYSSYLIRHCFYNISSVGIGTFNGWVKIFKLTLFAAFLSNHGASLVVQTVRNLPAMWETQVQSWVGNIPWRREWQLTPVCLSGEFHGQRSQVGYSPWSRKELDTTEATQHACMHWKRKWQPTPVFSPRESQGQRSLAGSSP